jgi:hypothetical protein
MSGESFSTDKTDMGPAPISASMRTFLIACISATLVLSLIAAIGSLKAYDTSKQALAAAARAAESSASYSGAEFVSGSLLRDICRMLGAQLGAAGQSVPDYEVATECLTLAQAEQHISLARESGKP